MKKTFVGFGFGPIQSALFLLEAYRSGNFSRFVVAEIDKEVVRAVRENQGVYTVNVAGSHGIRQYHLEGIEVYQPDLPEHRQALVEAVAQSDEMATALPSVRFYDVGNETSVAKTLAEGLMRRSRQFPTIVYAAENHNHAAEILTQELGKYLSPDARSHLQVLNTVIGKMSGIITEPEVMRKLNLETATPQGKRSVLVEEFNKILISRIERPSYQRGIDVFIEKQDLLPFEEAKLYGHNAIHAMMAYMADVRGLQTLSEVAIHPEIVELCRDAFIHESGTALIRRHAGLGDELFTEAGYRQYAEDLLERMVNPFLHDLVERVGRDHVRKLGYDDRLYGTMRIALRYGVEPRKLALGAAAGVVSLIRRLKDQENVSGIALPRDYSDLDESSLHDLLHTIWKDRVDENGKALVDLTWRGFNELGDLGWLQPIPTNQ